jgi:hypothetical protein
VTKVAAAVADAAVTALFCSFDSGSQGSMRPRAESRM